MLKIKDNVALKELGKFEFKDTGSDYIYGDEYSEFLFVESDKSIGIYFISSHIDGEVSDKILIKLFDLIQAGLVEKVGN